MKDKNKMIEFYKQILEDKRNKEEFDSSELLHNLVTTALKDIQYQEDIQGYGLNELYDCFDYIKENSPETIQDIACMALEGARINGTLTHWTAKTENLLLANFSIEEIIDKAMELSTNNPHHILIEFVEEELIRQLEDYDVDPIAAAASYLKDNGYEVDYQFEEEMEL